MLSATIKARTSLRSTDADNGHVGLARATARAKARGAMATYCAGSCGSRRLASVAAVARHRERSSVKHAPRQGDE